MKKDKYKIGIITYHEPKSYGANLQCLGLQMFLNEIGYNAEIIDYSSNAYLELRTTKRLKSSLNRSLRFLKNPIKYIVSRNNAVNIKKKSKMFEKELRERDDKFSAFQEKYYKLSPIRYEKYSELKNNCPNYDIFICGSDQIWNPRFCDMDDNYFLEFAPKGKRLAYAPSFGVKKIPFYARSTYKKRLKKIDEISIREDSGAKIIKDLINVDVPVVIDPSFLIDKDKWIEISNESNINLPDEYILTYFIGFDNYIENFFEDLKKVFPKYKIINLVFDKSSYGPCDFLKLINNAKFVFTNSFHGVAFCINFNIPFAVGKTLKDYGGNNGFSRIENLLNRFELNDRICDKNKGIDCEWITLNYNYINEKKMKIVEESKNYLNNAISNIIKNGG